MAARKWQEAVLMAARKWQEANGAKKSENGWPKKVRNGQPKKCKNERKTVETSENERKRSGCALC